MKEKFIQNMKETIPYLIAIVVIILIRTCTEKIKNINTEHKIFNVKKGEIN